MDIHGFQGWRLQSSAVLQSISFSFAALAMKFVFSDQDIQISPLYIYQLNTMSSVGLSGLSNISTEALQTRYEKALKQINKLIQINRQLKEAANEKEAMFNDLNTQIAQLQQTIRQLDEQNNILESKYMQLDGHCHQLEDYCKQLEQKLQLNQVDGQLFEQKLRQHQAKFHEQLQNQAMKYNELAREAEIIHHVYQQNLAIIQEHEARNKMLEQQARQLHQTIEKLESQKQKLTQASKQNNSEVLRKKLEQATLSIQRLTKQCSQLRSRQISLEVVEERQKVERSLGMSAVNDSRQSDAVKLLINQYRKKIFSLQSGKKQLETKYKHLKNKLITSSSENYQVKIEKLERLTQKQQLEIAKLIQTYDREINFMFQENVKLKEGLFALSQHFKQKSSELQEKERQISELKHSAQKVSFQNQSLKKFNQSLIQAQNSVFKDTTFLKKDISHIESFTLFEKQKSDQKISAMRKAQTTESQEAKNADFINLEEGVRQKAKTSEKPRASEMGGMPSKYQSANEPDFKFIQSVNIINGYNVNLGENNHYTKK